jgi:aminoglycoside 3-N-acetyltransferase
VTFLHYAEHVADIPGKRIARYKVPAEKEGLRVWKDMEEFNTAGDGVHPNWPDGFFAKIVDSFLVRSENEGGYMANSRTYLLRARELLDFALTLMKGVAADPRAGEQLHELATKR